MPLMREFFFYCSVRLGAIVAGVLSICQAVISIVMLFAIGANRVRKIAIELQGDTSDKDNFEMSMKILEENSDTFIIIVIGILCVHLIMCGLEIFGAFKLFKWLLIPFIILELIRLIILMALHIVSMMVLKDSINLGTLIALTVLGGFALLLLIYFWSCVIALFQIVTIINTDNYKTLYGNDPLAPWKPTSNDAHLAPVIGQSTQVENVKFYPSPDFSTYSPKKIGRKAGPKNLSNAVAYQNDVFTREFLELQYRTMPVNQRKF